MQAGKLQKLISSYTAFYPLLIFLLPQTICAHEFERSFRGEWWLAWNFDFWILFQLSIVAYLYRQGVHKLWQRIGFGRGIKSWQYRCFWLGMAILLLALVSPIDTISQELAYIHMIQHTLMMLLAAPLLVLAAPELALLCALANRLRQKLWRCRQYFQKQRWPVALLWHSTFIWLFHAIILWIWHLPILYVAALRFDFIHYLQHLSFFLAACFFWRMLFEPIKRIRNNQGLAILYLFTTSLHAAALGVFMALASEPWYIDYTLSAPRWGLSALEDQQLAGLIMWMPACLLYAFAAAIVLVMCFHELDRLDHKKSGLSNDR